VMSNKVIQLNLSIPASVNRVKLNINLADVPDERVQRETEGVEQYADDNTPPEYVQQEEKADNEHDEQLTVSEHVFLRESMYDERINRLKRELADKQPYQMVMDVAAVELHPDVHNLPHNIITVDQQANSVLPDVEETN
jgi:hypothetical protein